jgi:hypothetical protein
MLTDTVPENWNVDIALLIRIPFTYSSTELFMFAASLLEM